MGIDITETKQKVEVSQAGKQTVEITKTVKNVTVSTGTVTGTSTLPDVIDLAFKAAYQNYYHEFTYSGGVLSLIEIWESASKVTKLFTKSFTYTSGNLTGLVTTDLISSKTLSKTLTYDGGGILQTITRIYA